MLTYEGIDLFDFAQIVRVINQYLIALLWHLCSEKWKFYCENISNAMINKFLIVFAIFYYFWYGG